MALIEIEYGSLASSEMMNNNFNYLDNRVSGVSENLISTAASINSNIVSINNAVTSLSENTTTSLEDINSNLETINTALEEGAFFVTSYVNGTSWYKEYFSDEEKTTRVWLEQGGWGPYIGGGTSWNFATQIAFLKPFTTTNYNVQVTYKSEGHMDVSIGAAAYGLDSFQGYTSWAGDGKHSGFYHIWRACGV